MTATSGQGGQIGAQVLDEAVQAAIDALSRATVGPVSSSYRLLVEAAVKAAAPILAEAGRREVLAEATREWGVRYPHGVDRYPASSRDVAERVARDARSGLGVEAEAVSRYVTAWEPVDGGDS